MTNPLAPRIWEFSLRALMSPQSVPSNLAHAAFSQLLIDARRLTEMYWHIVDGDPIHPAGEFFEVRKVRAVGKPASKSLAARKAFGDAKNADHPQPSPEGICTTIRADSDAIQIVQTNPPAEGGLRHGQYSSLKSRDAARWFKWVEPNLETASRVANDIREEVIVGRIRRYTDKDQRIGYWETTFDVAIGAMHPYAKAIANIDPMDWQAMRRTERVDLADKLFGDLPSPDFGPRLQLAYQDAVRAAALSWLPPKVFKLQVRATFACLVLDAYADEQTPPFVGPVRSYINRLRVLANNELCAPDLADKIDAIADDERPAFRLANSSPYDRLKNLLIAAIADTPDPLCELRFAPNTGASSLSSGENRAQTRPVDAPAANEDNGAADEQPSPPLAGPATVMPANANARTDVALDVPESTLQAQAPAVAVQQSTDILELNELSVLWVLSKTPAHNRVIDIAAGLGLSRGTIGPVLNQLESRRLVFRKSRRGRWYLTALGKTRAPSDDPRRKR